MISLSLSLSLSYTHTYLAFTKVELIPLLCSVTWVMDQMQLLFLRIDVNFHDLTAVPALGPAH